MCFEHENVLYLLKMLRKILMKPIAECARKMQIFILVKAILKKT